MPDLNYENTRLLDIVNEKDEVIGLKSRREIHDLGLLHRQVHVWMFDEDRNIFFQKRGIHRPAAGLLDATVGGHVNKGENYLEAAIRETREETGISALPSDLILLGKLKNESSPEKKFPLTTNNFFQCVYIYKYPVKEEDITKERGIPGNDFQKLSYGSLHKSNQNIRMFLEFVYTREIPLVLKYLHAATK